MKRARRCGWDPEMRGRAEPQLRVPCPKLPIVPARTRCTRLTVSRARRAHQARAAAGGVEVYGRGFRRRSFSVGLPSQSLRRLDVLAFCLASLQAWVSLWKTVRLPVWCFSDSFIFRGRLGNHVKLPSCLAVFFFSLF